MSARRQHLAAYYQTDAGRQTIARRLESRRRNKALRTANKEYLAVADAIGTAGLTETLFATLSAMEAAEGFTATKLAVTRALERVGQANRSRLATEGWIA